MTAFADIEHIAYGQQQQDSHQNRIGYERPFGVVPHIAAFVRITWHCHWFLSAVRLTGRRPLQFLCALIRGASVCVRVFRSVRSVRTTVQCADQIPRTFITIIGHINSMTDTHWTQSNQSDTENRGTQLSARQNRSKKTSSTTNRWQFYHARQLSTLTPNLVCLCGCRLCVSLVVVVTGLGTERATSTAIVTAQRLPSDAIGFDWISDLLALLLWLFSEFVDPNGDSTQNQLFQPIRLKRWAVLYASMFLCSPVWHWRNSICAKHRPWTDVRCDFYPCNFRARSLTVVAFAQHYLPHWMEYSRITGTFSLLPNHFAYRALYSYYCITNQRKRNPLWYLICCYKFGCVYKNSHTVRVCVCAR